MTRRINGDALENRSGAAATGDVFVFDDAHVDGGEWEAPGAGSASAAWPVGSIFLSAVSTNPATLLGFGTWSAIGAGRVLIGIDAGDADFDTLGETGGAKTTSHTHGAGTLATDTHGGHTHGYGTIATVAESSHTHGAGTLAPSAHTGAAVGDHSDHVHTIGSIAASAHSGATVGDHSGASLSHVHNFTTGSITGSGDIGDKVGGGVSVTGTTGDNGPATLTHSVGQASAHTMSGNTGNVWGGLSAHSVTQPSAHTMSGTSSAGSSHSHGVSGSTASDGAHGHSVNSGSTGSTASSTVQPYLVVAMWQRTA